MCDRFLLSPAIKENSQVNQTKECYWGEENEGKSGASHISAFWCSLGFAVVLWFMHSAFDYRVIINLLKRCADEDDCEAHK